MSGHNYIKVIRYTPPLRGEDRGKVAIRGIFRFDDRDEADTRRAVVNAQELCELSGHVGDKSVDYLVAWRVPPDGALAAVHRYTTGGCLVHCADPCVSKLHRCGDDYRSARL